METAAAKRNHEVDRQTECGGMTQMDERTLGLRKYILLFKKVPVIQFLHPYRSGG